MHDWTPELILIIKLYEMKSLDENEVCHFLFKDPKKTAGLTRTTTQLKMDIDHWIIICPVLIETEEEAAVKTIVRVELTVVWEGKKKRLESSISCGSR